MQLISAVDGQKLPLVATDADRAGARIRTSPVARLDELALRRVAAPGARDPLRPV